MSGLPPGFILDTPNRAPIAIPLPVGPQQQRDNNRQDRRDATDEEIRRQQLAIQQAEEARRAREFAAKQQADAVAAQETALKMERYNQAKGKAVTDLNRGISGLDDVYNRLEESDGLWELAKTGAMARATGTGPGNMVYSGSDAANFDAMLKPIVSGATLSSLTDMRNASPTGAAVGNPTDKDMDLFKAAIGALDTTQDTDSFRRSMRLAREAHIQNLSRVDPQAARRAKATNPRLDATGGMNALERGYRSLVDQTRNYTPEQRAAALRAYDADPAVQTLKSRAGFRDPGGTRTAAPPSQAREGWWNGTRGAPRKSDDIPEDIKAIAARLGRR